MTTTSIPGIRRATATFALLGLALLGIGIATSVDTSPQATQSLGGHARPAPAHTGLQPIESSTDDWPWTPIPNAQ